jgi:hypothetical protein
MALTDIEKVRLLIGDVPNSPFYQLFTDEEIQEFLDLSGGNVLQAARMAAIAASMQIAGYNTRERTGDIEVWNSLSTQYLKALQNLIDTPTAYTLPNGLMPYAAGISWADVCANDQNPDNVRPPLTQIKVCGGCGCESCKCVNTKSHPFDICGC